MRTISAAAIYDIVERAAGVARRRTLMEIYISCSVELIRASLII